MAIKDALLHFTTIGTPFAPTATGDNIAPNTIDLAPLGLPAGSGGAGTPGYNAGTSVNAGRDLGIGGEMWLEVLVITAVTSGGAATVNFELVTDSTPTIVTPNILMQSGAIAKATLVAGYRFIAQLPASLVYLEYLGLDVNIGTAVLTAGSFEGKLLKNIQASDLYLSGFAVA